MFIKDVITTGNIVVFWERAIPAVPDEPFPQLGCSISPRRLIISTCVAITSIVTSRVSFGRR